MELCQIDEQGRPHGWKFIYNPAGWLEEKNSFSHGQWSGQKMLYLPNGELQYAMKNYNGWWTMVTKRTPQGEYTVDWTFLEF